MSRIKELIKKLWEGNLSSAESRELDDLITHNDHYFRDELEKEFYLAVAPKDQQSEPSRPSKVIAIWRYSWKIAASLIIGTLLVQLFFYQGSQSLKQQFVSSKKVTVSQDSELVTRVNNTDKDMPVHLSDGSVVILSTGSSLVYKRQFDEHKRNVSLIGKAYFKVQKNPSKPFSVLTGVFATTALGTEFEVNTLVNHRLVVTLFTGKVMVYSTDSANSFNTVYLTPGQLVSINTRDYTVNERREFSFKDKMIFKTELPVGKPTNMNFENESLAKVFDTLSNVYKIPIEYDRELIEGLYFSGYVLPTDSMNNIINLIANMNGLVVMHKGEHIVIKKK